MTFLVPIDPSLPEEFSSEDFALRYWSSDIRFGAVRETLAVSVESSVPNSDLDTRGDGAASSGTLDRLAATPEALQAESANDYEPSYELGDLDGQNGFTFVSAEQNARVGYSVAAIGDFNGDGFDDVLVGANRATADGDNYAGQSYVIFGKPGPFSASLGANQLDGSNGFVIDGIDPDDRSGSTVASAGDFNGDGFDDLLIGAPIFCSGRADPCLHPSISPTSMVRMESGSTGLMLATGPQSRSHRQATSTETGSTISSSALG